ncbi:cyanophycinase [Pseudoalteromonas ulvae]|uniref:Cyanophycinase n=3 Tax=Pseudoalteromonas ulvae TaxID=107327 RepID=A0A244CT96_PSEDV|nr:cyanophycinase [Pseudoalteromonas ulvae]
MKRFAILLKAKTIGWSFIFALLLSLFSPLAVANDRQQTLVLIGGALTTCSSMSEKNCLADSVPKGKKTNLYQFSKTAIKQIERNWPSDNQHNKVQTIRALNQLASVQSASISKRDLLWLWRDFNDEQLSGLSDQEYHFVIDMLEQPVTDKQEKRVKETVAVASNIEPASNEIVNFIAASTKVKTTTPHLLAITASSRDPYEAADFYEGLLTLDGITSEWLPLTPALAKAVAKNRCDLLAQFREQEMAVFNREHIYPDRIQAEHALCEKGAEHLVAIIEASTGVMFNGGDQSLTRQVLFDEQGHPYLWTTALQNRPVLIGTSAGTALQSGGRNSQGAVPMISNGTSLSALRFGAYGTDAPSERIANANGASLNQDSLTYQALGGLGSFNYGVLDTHFSERNRTARLATLLKATNQTHGFGIDETTALVVITSPSSQLMTVVGKHGVVHLTQRTDQSVGYSYWPAGAVIMPTATGFALSQRSIDNALSPIAIPALPSVRFNDLLTEGKLRSLTQAMCLTAANAAQGQQNEFLIDLKATPETAYHRLNSGKFGCAIEKLTVEFSSPTSR